MKIQFRDAAIHISSTADGDLSIAADDEIDLTSTLIDINGNVEISGTTAQVGVLTTTATQVATGGITSGSDIVSDTDSTDDLGTTGVRWANLFVDAITATDQITATGFTGTLDGILGSGAAAAATTTTLDTSGVVNLNLTTDSTSSTSGALIIDGGVGVAKKLFVGTDLDVDGTANLDIVDIDGAVNMATTALVTGVLTTTATQVATGGITSGSNIVSDTDSTDDLGTTSVRWANLFVDAITTTGEITATGFTGTLDGILGSGAAAAATVTTLTGTTITAQTAFVPDASDGAALGTTALEFSDLFLADGAVINLGDDQDVTITHVADTGIALNSKDIAGVASINSGQLAGSRNKIINGAMEINQRGTAAVDADQKFPSDRFKTAEAGGGNMTAQVVADAPAFFRNSIKVIASTADDCSQAADEYRIMHRIEGNNVVDLYYGNSGAKTTTLSFYVKSSLTGAFPVSLENAASNRSHVKQYTIAQANTWEKKSITFVGDEAGTWLITNGTGLTVSFVLGAGSNYTGTIDSWQGSRLYRGSSSVQFMATVNATWFVTGVQLEVGSTDTEFEYRSIGDELALCQRYSTVVHPATSTSVGNGFVRTTTTAYASRPLPVVMRATPTLSFSAAADFEVQSRARVDDATGMATSECGPDTIAFVATIGGANLVVGDGIYIRDNIGDGETRLVADAEL